MSIGVRLGEPRFECRRPKHGGFIDQDTRCRIGGLRAIGQSRRGAVGGINNGRSGSRGADIDHKRRIEVTAINREHGVGNKTGNPGADIHRARRRNRQIKSLEAKTNIAVLGRICRCKFGQDARAIAINQREVFPRRRKAKVRVQLRTRNDAVLTGGKHDQELARRQSDARRKRPLLRLGRIVGESHPGEIDG